MFILARTKNKVEWMLEACLCVCAHVLLPWGSLYVHMDRWCSGGGGGGGGVGGVVVKELNHWMGTIL